MSQITIKANENNDLKYRQGLYNLDPNSWPLKDPARKNNDPNSTSISEGGNSSDGELQYFTE